MRGKFISLSWAMFSSQLNWIFNLLSNIRYRIDDRRQAMKCAGILSSRLRYTDLALNLLFMIRKYSSISQRCFVISDDLYCLIAQAHAHGVEAISHRFLADLFVVESADRFLRNFPFRHSVCQGDKLFLPDEIYNHPNNQFVADFLGKVEFLKGESKDGRIHLLGTDQYLPYDGEKRGMVEIAVRPENITMSAPGDAGLKGRVDKRYYLGDSADWRIALGKTNLRVITEGRRFSRFAPGDEVGLYIEEFLVFDDEGTLKEQLKIVT